MIVNCLPSTLSLPLYLQILFLTHLPVLQKKKKKKKSSQPTLQETGSKISGQTLPCHVYEPNPTWYLYYATVFEYQIGICSVFICI